MDRIEEVKKILEKYKVWVLNLDHGQGERCNQDDAAQQICQLFEPQPETPIHLPKAKYWKLKPDESRLLDKEMIKVSTATEWLANNEGKFPKSDFTLDEVLNFVKKMITEQDAETASIIGNLLDAHIASYMDNHGVKLGYGLAYKALSEFRQALWKE